MIEHAKIEARTSHSLSQMTAEMPIARAAENNLADFFQELEAFAAFGGSDPEASQLYGCALGTSPVCKFIAIGSGFGGEYGKPSIWAVRATSRRR